MTIALTSAGGRPTPLRCLNAKVVHRKGMEQMPISRSDVVASSGIVARCSVPDDHIDPRRRALFVARSILSEIWDGGRAC
jgi:hypothetical protein